MSNEKKQETPETQGKKRLGLVSRLKEKRKERKKRPAPNPNFVVLKRTLFLMGLFGAVTFIPLVGRLFWIQVVHYDDIRDRVIEQQTMDRAVAPNRGTIYDSSGSPLAISAEAYYVQLAPKEILECQADYQEQVAEAEQEPDPGKREKLMPSWPEPTTDRLAADLSRLLDIEQMSVVRAMEKTSSRNEVLKRGMTADEADAVRRYASENHLNHGIYVRSSAQRYYPFNSLASHVIGWVNVNDNNRGAYGMEAIYDKALSGEVGRVITAKNGLGGQMLYHYENYEDPQDGDDVHLTINNTIQHYCERVLAEGVEKFEAQDGGFIIAMDPKSGAIKAWANSPTYDLNKPRTVVDDNLNRRLAEIMSDPALTDEQKSEKSVGLLYEQWNNKAITDTYEPGSTFKSVVLAAALEEGVVDENTVFECTGGVHVDGYPGQILCSNRRGHGTQNLAQAVANSCNPAFINIGQRLGTDIFYDYLEAFGFKEKTGVDMQGERAPTDLSIWPRSEFGPVDLAVASFGQRFEVTPIQLITAASAVVNGGHLMRPYVVDSVVDANGNVLQHTQPTEVRQVVSESTSQRCRTILEQVVTPPGTGKMAYEAGYRIGGKTGSSQTTEKDHTIVSFLGFAPADDPQIIVLIAYDNPKPASPGANTTEGGYYISGGSMAALQAGELLPQILDYLGVEKQYTDAEKAAVDVNVPSILGLTAEQAQAHLRGNGLDIRIEGEGERVTDQIPAQGVPIPGGSKVVAYMGTEKPEDRVLVPNVVGMNREEATAAMAEAGVYLKSTGLVVGTGVEASRQGVEAGTPVRRGTVVEVHFVQNTVIGGSESGV